MKQSSKLQACMRVCVLKKPYFLLDQNGSRPRFAHVVGATCSVSVLSSSFLFFSLNLRYRATEITKRKKKMPFFPRNSLIVKEILLRKRKNVSAAVRIRTSSVFRRVCKTVKLYGPAVNPDRSCGRRHSTSVYSKYTFFFFSFRCVVSFLFTMHLGCGAAVFNPECIFIYQQSL